MLRMSGSNKRARDTDRSPALPVLSGLSQDGMNVSNPFLEDSVSAAASALRRASSLPVSSLMNGFHRPPAASFMLRSAANPRPVPHVYDTVFWRQKLIMADQREMLLRQQPSLRQSSRIDVSPSGNGSRYAAHEKISNIIDASPAKLRRAVLKRRSSLRTASNLKLRSFPLPKLTGEGCRAKLGSLRTYRKRWKELTLEAENKWEDKKTRKQFVKHHFANALNSDGFDQDLPNQVQIDNG